MKESIAFEFSSKDLDEMERINSEMCSALVGSEQFIKDQVVVTPVDYNLDTEDYGFVVYFDRVIMDLATTSVRLVTEEEPTYHLICSNS